MHVSSNKIIIALSAFISVDLAIITYTWNVQPPSQEIYVENRRVLPAHPKIGFAEIIAKGLPAVLGTDTIFMPTPTPTPALSKKVYTIAAIGDSMIETMGPSLDYVLRGLKQKYPGTEFITYNYGIGGEKVTGGLFRLNKPFDQIGRHYPAISDLKPDFLIVGSYAYNPFDVPNPTVHRNQLAELVNQARQISGKVYMLAEIAPLKDGFGVGPGGVNWPENLADKQTAEIEDQMKNVFDIAKTLTVPVIDVYDQSKDFASNYGQQKYVSGYDGIHPSEEGEIFMAKIIVDNLELR